MDYFNAFWTGGLICALVQILLDRTKLMPGRIMVLLVCTGSVLSAVGIYQPFAEFASGICKDAGYASLGKQIEIFGKLTILAVSMPVLLALFGTLDQILT